jgi:hypothetical protein
MEIYFQLRKYKHSLGISFSVKDGEHFADGHQYLIGDSVHLLFEVTKEQAEAINALGKSDHRISVDSLVREPIAHIPFRVVERGHALSLMPRSNNTMQHLSASLTLEATTGYWEDFLIWILDRQKPEWVDE